MEKKRIPLPSGCLPRQSTIPAQHSAATHKAWPPKILAAGHSPSGLRQKSVEAEPCSFWMVQRYVPQSTGDARTIARAAGPSSPALQRAETFLVRVMTMTRDLRPNSHGCWEPRLWEPWGGGERFQGQKRVLNHTRGHSLQDLGPVI